MVLTILSAATLGVLGLFGLFRGVRRGLIAVAGTLLGAVLIDLWQNRWSNWLNAQDQPTTWAAFVITATVFVLVVLLVGYGGSLLLAPELKAKPPGLFDRLLGAFVGALNGALIVSYLLRYASESWPSDEFTTLIASSFLASLLDTWLPWFVLTMITSTAIFVFFRGTMRILRALSRPAIEAAMEDEYAAGIANPQAKSAAASQVATPPASPHAKDHR
ncbi:MAG: CvpA family protein [Oscillochloris sp.]|nr:CvpA family protein [Oscillochloris sp.]